MSALDIILWIILVASGGCAVASLIVLIANLWDLTRKL